MEPIDATMGSMKDQKSSKPHEEPKRSMSIDTADAFGPPGAGVRPLHRPAMSPYMHYGGQSGRFPIQQTRVQNHPLQSVVTASFSADEREAFRVPGSASKPGASAHYKEQRYDREERYIDSGERDDWGSRHQFKSGYPSEHTGQMGPPQEKTDQPRTLQRAYSTPAGNAPRSPAIKRNYFHHIQTSEAPRELPSEFMPPKRSKIGEPKELAVSPSLQNKRIKTLGPSFLPRSEWTPPRNGPWDSEEGTLKHILRSQSYPVPPSGWNSYQQTDMGNSLAGASRGSFDVSSLLGSTTGHRWSKFQPQQSPWPLRKTHPWNSSQQGLRIFTGYSDVLHSQQQEQHVETLPPRTTGSTASDGKKLMGLVPLKGDSVIPGRGMRTLETESGEKLILLALQEDRGGLSETLCLVRENIEVFPATQQDVDAPAPGRKHAVSVGQVGLRCIHCRHTTKASDRVKRAVCYPSSLKRIYRTVIDMKLDHFSHCKFVPDSLKTRLDQLKAIQTRSTGTTMQFFIEAAKSLGMTDAPTGVVFTSTPNPNDTELLIKNVSTDIPAATERRTGSNVSSSSISDSASSARSDVLMSTESFDTFGSRDVHHAATKGVYYEGIVPLALAEDRSALSPLRCFLRENVCAFSATEADLALRAPSTFSITVGQVGIGCIHCVRQDAKIRSNRAICFPFSINRIYQSVADIQRFHFGECQLIPQEVKEKFTSLQNASSKGSKGLATRQYWVNSAKRIGLVDTPQGIRFARDPSKPSANNAFSLDILAQVAFSVTTSSKQLVLPEDKPHIAEFLYVVMEQLQPCRFTEADRNKRRLKDVGCIGVECKHCAGQVDGRKFFWSSVSAVESNFVSVHTHMLECRMVPPEIKERLTVLKQLRKEQTAALRSGSQKAFFSRVWQRLHNDEQHSDEQCKAQEESRDEDNSTEGTSKPREPEVTEANESSEIVPV